jgi:glycosyltransferase involved in cell wall biosynthesis
MSAVSLHPLVADSRPPGVKPSQIAESSPAGEGTEHAPIKVLLASGFFESQLVSFREYAYSAELRAQGHHVTLMCGDQSYIWSRSRVGLPVTQPMQHDAEFVVRTGTRLLRRRVFFRASDFVLYLPDVAAIRNADVVHVIEFRQGVTLAVALLAWAFGKPVVYDHEQRGDRSARWYSRVDSIFRRALIGVGARVVDCVRHTVLANREHFASCTPRRVRTMFAPLGADIARFHHDETERRRVRMELDLPSDARVAVMSGKLHAEKRIVDVVKACEAASVHVILVGTLAPDVARELARIGAPFSSTGEVSSDRLRALYNAADIAIFTTFSVSYWEAYATGIQLLVPATRFTALIFENKPGVTCFGSPSMFAIEDEQYRPDVDVREALTQALLKVEPTVARRSRDDFSREQTGRRLAALYRELLDERRRQATADPSHAGASKRRWLLIDGSSTFGGHEVMLARWIGELGAQGRVVPRLLAREGSMLREKLAEHAVASDLRDERRLRGWLGGLRRMLSDVQVVRQAIEREDPELCVLAEGCLLSQPLLALLCKLSGRPFVTYIPITDSTRSLGFRTGRIRDFLTRTLFGNLPDAWVTLTPDQASDFTSWAKLRRAVFVLPNAVSPPIEAESRNHASSAQEGERSQQRVLVLGRLDSYQKGLDFLLQFVASHAQALAGVTIRLVGDGPFEADVRAALQRTPALATLLELAPFSDPVSAMRTHDVLLLPSRFEGVPLVMLEAMALGLPVVASDLPGTRAFLPPECLFRVGELTRAFEIVRGLRDPERRRDVIARNRERFTAAASGAAFSDAVARLTQSLGELASAKRLGQPMAQPSYVSVAKQPIS